MRAALGDKLSRTRRLTLENKKGHFRWLSLRSTPLGLKSLRPYPRAAWNVMKRYNACVKQDILI